MARGGQQNHFEPLATTPASGSSQRLASTMEDSNSPFYLHSGDNPGLTMVSHPLNGPNYNTWSISMLMALNAKNKVGFVDGTLQRPSSDDLTFSFWSRCNSIVTSWLLNSVTKEIADSLLYLESARDVWNDLYERFHQSNVPRIFQIKMLLLGLSQGSLDVHNYYTKLKILWDELKDYQPVPVCSCGGMKKWMEYQQQEYVMQFLMGLNDSFASIRVQILMIGPLPSISKTFSLVVQEERQRTIGAEVAATPESMVFQSSTFVSPLPVTNAVAAFNRYKPRGNRPSCTHCGLMGHTVDNAITTWLSTWVQAQI
ncbi:uncharacterized protein LOC112092002 [Morus notabilis]|uniref:uncharacterized protein LOC112092002 n=1 Tax=Morus notabilis TaxID=981085 RepID=UPI000CED5B63|nr:uncharacterized protein LOC112092002 [Morus notabilis]